ncbi:glmZ(sRNA)-inactivating NTPase [Enhygromyxa salina]|uniref:GlmZ(SRNA)-inactivating NTPase n=1 Tax=Enhygromyxa salina TaxID=215803 RepID=A0A2S9YDS8_9BACT|nr:RNase adapter RapZ [Enhygromyxa salina]PRQ03263.1 glmZ(sRNA)-inactivating NTPase [Enhygromyxa salina]
MEILVVTGLSGAGKSTCLRALEDLGYYCIDNLPVPMLPALVETKLASPAPHPGPTRLAIGIDARAEEHLHAFAEVREQLLAEGHTIEVLFLEAPDPTIVRRFSETRRRHPMGELPEAIRLERARLRELRALADAVIDSENSSSRQLRRLVRDRYGTRGGALHLVLMSFGFKNGLPSEADLVFDARFLQNPFDVPQLRAKGGFDGPVRDYVLSQDDAREVLERVESWLRFQAPRTIHEGRSYLTVALGCTGGQHRSVALTEELHRRLASEPVAEPAPVLTVRHRDLEQALADTAHLAC